jgi:hypothetical protein
MLLHRPIMELVLRLCRKLNRQLSLLLLLVALGLRCGVLVAQPLAMPLELRAATTTVGRFEKIEFEIHGLESDSNPFDPAVIDARLELTDAKGRRSSLPAFHAQPYERRRVQGRDWIHPVGSPAWKARFAPMTIGRFEVVAVVKDTRGERRSPPVTFDCVPSQSKGFLRVSQRDPRFLEFSEGQPFFAIGQNLAFIGSGQYMTLSRAEETFGRLAANGANYLRIWTCCEDWALALEARKSAWDRSWSRRAPVVPMPDDPARTCLRLTSTNAALEVNPSHPVALRPNTRYTVTGKLRIEPGSALWLEAFDTTTEVSGSADSPGWHGFRHEFTTGPEQLWLGAMRFRLDGPGTAWLADLSLKDAGDGPELLWEAELNRPTRGFYNPVDCFMLDELVSAALRHGVYLQLCLLTRDLYMDALKDPTSPAYDQAIADAQNLLRYAVARWGYATSVAAWEYWNEMNPNLPTDRFYTELGEFLERTDPYGHLRTTSTWGPSPKDCRHPELDLADTHFYLRPTDRNRLADEVEAIQDRVRWLHAQAPDKPALLAEFGLADDQWRITDEMKRSRSLVDVHNALWAAALSGASGTALCWWWERMDERDVYPLYRAVSAFVADVPWTNGELRPAALNVDDPRLRVQGLQTRDRAWLWLFHRAASWQNLVTEKRTAVELPDIVLELNELPDGTFRVEWWDPHNGEILSVDHVPSQGHALRLVAPAFTRDLAVKVSCD